MHGRKGVQSTGKECSTDECVGGGVGVFFYPCFLNLFKRSLTI